MRRRYKYSFLFGVAVILAAFFWVNISDAREQVTIHFENETATINIQSDAVVLTGTEVTISGPGIYILEGYCQDGSVTVAKNAGEVQLVLNGLSLASNSTAPLVTKGGTTDVTVTAAEGTENTLSDTDRGAEKPKSAVNASAAITFNGKGSLTVTGNNKNGIKSDTDVTIEDLELEVYSTDHGIAADNLLTVNSGNLTVVSGGDALRSSPDEITEETKGNVVISDGTFDLNAVGDAIQADNNLTIYDGNFRIATNGGHETVVSAEADSCKGLKANDTLAILGGSFYVDAADDAFHSNAYCYLTSGTFTIASGDDAAHADTSLILGEENGVDDNLMIEITDCYEGLEAGTVYLYSGIISVTSTDDGINAAGDSGSNDSFQPGGGNFPGGGGQQGPNTDNTGSSDYSIQIYGGDIWVNAEGDGLDSNGDITMSGGRVTVFGASADGMSSDNVALDFDGRFTLTGGTLFAAGSAQMAQIPTVSGQNTVTVSKSRNDVVKAGTYINVISQNEAVYAIQTSKAVNHIFYTSAELAKGATVTFTAEPACAPDTPGKSESETPDENESESETMTESESEAMTESETTSQSESETTGNGESETSTTGSGSQNEGQSGHEQATPMLQAIGKTYTSIKLQWTGIDKASSYQIYRSTKKNGTYSKIKTLNSTSYIDKGIKTGKTYYYKVRARVQGVWQNFSEVKSAKATLGSTSINKVTKKNKAVTLKWKKIAGAFRYEVFFSTRKASGYTKLATVKKNKMTAAVSGKVKAKRIGYFKVRAYCMVDGKKVYGSFSAAKAKQL